MTTEQHIIELTKILNERKQYVDYIILNGIENADKLFSNEKYILVDYDPDEKQDGMAIMLMANIFIPTTAGIATFPVMSFGDDIEDALEGLEISIRNHFSAFCRSTWVNVAPFLTELPNLKINYDWDGAPDQIYSHDYIMPEIIADWKRNDDKLK